MPEDIKVPGLGELPKKYVIGGVVVAGGIVVIVYFRHKSSATAAAATDTTGTSATGTTTDPSIDPATGIPYAQEQQSSAIDPSTGIPFAEETGYGSDYGGLGNYGSYGTVNPNPLTGSSTITTNEDWIGAAESGIVPGSQATIAAAVTKILAGLPVTNAQRDIFLEAVGIIGNPPQGYPQPIKLKDTAAHPNPGGPDKHTHRKPHTIEATGHEDLSQIAHANDVTGGALVRENIFLAPYYGNTKKIKAGTRIKVP